MKRRDFSAQVIGLATVGLGGVGLGSESLAQSNDPVAGRQYQVLQPPAPAGTAGKLEVVEFFWYGCPHCYAFEPLLDEWVKRLPSDVLFRRVPVAFRQDPFVIHQKLYFSLEAMGLIDKLQRKVFDEIHLEQRAKGEQRSQLSTLEQINMFLDKQGVDKAQFLSVFNSFAVNTKLGQAQKLVSTYQLNGVPALGIQSRFLTDGPMAGGMDKALQVTDFLLQKLRKGA